MKPNERRSSRSRQRQSKEPPRPPAKKSKKTAIQIDPSNPDSFKGLFDKQPNPKTGTTQNKVFDLTGDHSIASIANPNKVLSESIVEYSKGQTTKAAANTMVQPNVQTQPFPGNPQNAQTSFNSNLNESIVGFPKDISKIGAVNASFDGKNDSILVTNAVNELRALLAQTLQGNQTIDDLDPNISGMIGRLIVENKDILSLKSKNRFLTPEELGCLRELHQHSIRMNAVPEEKGMDIENESNQADQEDDGEDRDDKALDSDLKFAPALVNKTDPQVIDDVSKSESLMPQPKAPELAPENLAPQKSVPKVKDADLEMKESVSVNSALFGEADFQEKSQSSGCKETEFVTKYNELLACGYYLPKLNSGALTRESFDRLGDPEFVFLYESDVCNLQTDVFLHFNRTQTYMILQSFLDQEEGRIFPFKSPPDVDFLKAACVYFDPTNKLSLYRRRSHKMSLQEEVRNLKYRVSLEKFVQQEYIQDRKTLLSSFNNAVKHMQNLEGANEVVLANTEFWSLYKHFNKESFDRNQFICDYFGFNKKEFDGHFAKKDPIKFSSLPNMFMNNRNAMNIEGVDFKAMYMAVGDENFMEFISTHATAKLSTAQQAQLIDIENLMVRKLNEELSSLRIEIERNLTSSDLARFLENLGKCKTMLDVKNLRTLLHQTIEDQKKNPGVNPAMARMLVFMQRQKAEDNLELGADDQGNRSLKSVNTVRPNQQSK